MKITYLSNSIIPSRYANSVQVMKMCEALAKNGHDIVLYARKPSNKIKNVYRFYGVSEVFKIKWKEWPNLRGVGGFIFAYRVNKDLQNNQLPDLIYGRSHQCLFLARKHRIPMIFESHSIPKNYLEKEVIKRITKKDSLVKTVVTSDAIKEVYKNEFPWLDKNKLVVVRNGADVVREKDDKPILISGSAIKVGYVGHLYPDKGIDIIHKVAQKLPKLEFHIVGGSEKDVAFWSNVIKLDNVTFHGHVPNSDLTNYYRSFDILIAPYKKTSISFGGSNSVDKYASPLKIMEYMAQKKPIIASDLPMVKETIRHMENGLLCKPDDITSWVDTIKLVADDKEISMRISENAYNEFINHYTWEKRAEIIIEKTRYLG